MVKKFGCYWNQRMTEQEWDDEIPTLFNVIEDGINNKEDLKQFVLKLQTFNDMVDEKPLYKWYFFPNFGKNESVILFKCHHAFADGLGVATLLQCYNGKYDSDALPKMKPISTAFWLFTILISPLLFL